MFSFIEDFSSGINVFIETYYPFILSFFIALLLVFLFAITVPEAIETRCDLYTRPPQGEHVLLAENAKLISATWSEYEVGGRTIRYDGQNWLSTQCWKVKDA